MVCGFGNFVIVCTFWSMGSNPLVDMWWPKNVRLVTANSHFSLFNATPFCLKRSSSSRKCCSNSSKECEATRTSST